MFGHWIFVYLSLGILDIALVEMLGYWILGIGSLKIMLIATLLSPHSRYRKTEQYSAYRPIQPIPIADKFCIHLLKEALDIVQRAAFWCMEGKERKV